MSDILRVYEEDGVYWVDWYGEKLGALTTPPRMEMDMARYNYGEYFASQRYSISFEFIEAPRPVEQRPKRKRKQSDLGLRRPK